MHEIGIGFSNIQEYGQMLRKICSQPYNPDVSGVVLLLVQASPEGCFRSLACLKKVLRDRCVLPDRVRVRVRVRGG